MEPGPGRPPRRKRHDPVSSAEPIVPPGPSTVDLHAHTTRSDGILTPRDLVAHAFAAGVRTFALTDHDTLAGYRDVVAAGATPVGMALLPGVEINALVTPDLGLWEGELHILGFGMDPDDDAFEATMRAQRARRRTRFGRTVERLRELDLAIDAQVEAMTTEDDDALGRPTVARALIEAGFASSARSSDCASSSSRSTPRSKP